MAGFLGHFVGRVVVVVVVAVVVVVVVKFLTSQPQMGNIHPS